MLGTKSRYSLHGSWRNIVLFTGSSVGFATATLFSDGRWSEYLSVMDIRDSVAVVLNMRCTRYVFMYRQLARWWQQGAGDGMGMKYKLSAYTRFILYGFVFFLQLRRVSRATEPSLGRMMHAQACARRLGSAPVGVDDIAESDVTERHISKPYQQKPERDYIARKPAGVLLLIVRYHSGRKFKDRCVFILITHRLLHLRPYLYIVRFI